MTKASNNTALASVAFLVIFALVVAWYVNTHQAPASDATATSTPVNGSLQGTVK